MHRLGEEDSAFRLASIVGLEVDLLGVVTWHRRRQAKLGKVVEGVEVVMTGGEHDETAIQLAAAALRLVILSPLRRELDQNAFFTIR